MKIIISKNYDGSNRKLYSKKCQNCKKTFYVPKNRLEKRKCCSLKCSGELKNKNSNPKNVTCSYCEKIFTINKSKYEKSNNKIFFCCRKHKDLAQKISFGLKIIHPEHYGEISSNYREIAFETYPHKCNRCGWKKDERLLQVHHKDKNRKNNNVKNLEILCPICHWGITLGIYK